jgi:hypothetical protein
MASDHDDFGQVLPERVGEELHAQMVLHIDMHAVITDPIGDFLLEAVPFLSTLAKSYKALIGIREYLFLRKLQRFLLPLREVAQQERAAFIAKIEQDKEFRDRVGMYMVMLFDRLDDIDKPQLVARAFKAFLRQEINLETFQRMATAIERCALADFPHLRKLEVNQAAQLPAPVASSLYLSGLTELASVLPIGRPGALNKFQLSDFGRQFIEVVLDSERS